VEKFIDTPVKRFSSGMQVRLAFSVAAYLEPEILLIDEVLAVGDAEFQKKCLGKMKDVALGGRTVLFVSHNMSAVNKLCSRTLMLENGRLIADGDTNSVVSKYLGQNLTAGAIISREELAKKMEGVIRRSSPTIRLKEVALFNEQGLLCSIFNSDEPIKICVTYECLVDTIDLRLAVHIVDEENRPILISQNSDDSGEAGYYERKAGTYKSFCIIPPNTFGQKRLHISIHLIHIKTEHLVLNKILMFDVIFHGYNMQYGEWRDAFLRPQLKWNTDFIG
jgi:lipopolysaccharide transport system ATP-binding protein